MKKRSQEISAIATSAPRRKYDEEFKGQALRMIAQRQPVRSVATALGINENIYQINEEPEELTAETQMAH